MSGAPAPLTGAEIAVVGMAVRAPGAATLDAFWDNLSRGVESITRFSSEELTRSGELAELRSDPNYVNARPVLEHIDQFDAAFFGLSPQDAAITDPQHRVFLEVGWEALEHAGHTASRFNGQVGVFATCGMNAYMMYHLVTNPRIMRTVGEWLVRHTGNDMSFLATSLSYLLDLKGPSMNVQCACSSALVAIHLAAQSLLNGECDMALAGGSVIVLPQDRGYLYQEGEILSRDGHCRPFDAGATGTLFGSGAGVVVLRRLSDALADGDNVLAVIKGSAVNNDGAMKVGFLAPSVEGQSRVITEALAVSGVHADTISYIEAHGTGTVVGDPIEVTALTEAFRRHTAKRGFCWIGSLKSNIGHVGEAAGVLAFIKTVLSLQHRQLPPSLNYATPNPRVDFAASPFVVNDALRDWTSEAMPRRAGVTALGAGGTNCHVILEEAPPSPPSSPSTDEHLLVLSAKTLTALERMRANLAAALDRVDAPRLADTAYTLQVGRAEHGHRWSAVCASHVQAVMALRSGGVTDHARLGRSRAPVVFLFPGGGVQYPNMGRGVYDRETVFRSAVDHCLTVLRDQHGVDLRPALFPDATSLEEAAHVLSRSTQSILSIFTIEYALARLWMSWGVTPAAMSGHSLGEYVAACLAGVFSVEDALTIVKARGDIFERLAPGAMLSVLLPEVSVAPHLDGHLSLAAINSPSSCVVSGPVDEIADLERRLTAAEIETQPLHIAVTAHSPMLDPFLDEFRRTVSSVRLAPPMIPFVSNLTGTWIATDEATDPSYWVRHLRQPVRFSDGLMTLLSNPDQVLLEVGPGRALTSLARQHTTKPLGLVTSLRHPNEDLSDAHTLLTALGRVWALGGAPNWAAVHGDTPHWRVPLPTYPFERQRHWIDAGVPAASPAVEAVSVVHGTEKRPDVAEWFYVPEWRSAPAVEPEVSTPPGDILVFADEGGIARAAAARLRKNFEGRVHVVQAGQRFSRLDGDRFAVNPLQADDYVALFGALGETARAVSHIVYGWTLSPRTTDAESIDQQLDRHFFGPLALAQAIARQELDQPIALTFLTRGMVQIAGETPVVPGAATLVGPSRVMPREFPNMSTRIVDVVASASPGQHERLAAQLASELARAPSEATVAYRGQTRWTESFSHRRLSREGRSRLRDQGVYLITGGLGGLGLEIATHLARTYHANLVLIGRKALPARPDWDRWLADHGPDDPTARRITRVRECEALGGRVLVATADVTNPKQLATVRQQILDTFGAIHGIFHGAGTLDDGLMQLKTRESALAVLRPKVHGTLALDAVFGGDPLDFLALFSSVSSVFGLQGQVDYTAANAFLDAFATGGSPSSTPTMSIGWGPWRDVGLAVSSSLGRRGPKGRAAAHPWLDRVTQAPSGEITINLLLGRDRQWMIGEHVVRGGAAVLPGTGYLELARAALAEFEPSARTFEITDLFFQAPIVVPAGEDTAIELSLKPSGAGYEGMWHTGEVVYATGHVGYSNAAPPPRLDVGGVRARCTIRVDEPRGFLAQPFMDFGPRWANIERISYGAGEALLELALPTTFRDDTRQFLLHPALLDMATGGAQALIPGFDQANDFYVPFSYGRVRVCAGLPPSIVSHVRLAEGTSHSSAVFDVTIADGSGAILADISGFCMRRVSTLTAMTQTPSPLHAIGPVPTPVMTAGALADELLQQGLTPAEGLDALERVLSFGLAPRVLVSTGDLAAWHTRVDEWQASVGLPAAHPAGAGDLQPAALDGDIETRLGQMWKDLLGVASVGPRANFFDMGGHSLLAVRLLTRINRAFGCSISLPALFAGATVEELAARVRVATENPDWATLETPTEDEFELTAVPRDQLRLSRGSLDKPRGH